MLTTKNGGVKSPTTNEVKKYIIFLIHKPQYSERDIENK